jgi:transcriptional regulator with PAS, ATPase and Fis domain
MQEKDPHGPVAAASVIFHVQDQNYLRKLDSECAVVVSDQEPARLQFIQCLLDNCGVRAQWLEEFSEAEQIERSGCCRIALVALQAGAVRGDPSFEVISSLNQKGFMVISYGDAIDSWPLSARCRALIAGSALILDSGRVEFAQRLKSLVVQHVRLESGRRADEDNVKTTMKALGVVGESQAMLSVFAQVLRVSRVSDLPTLITGESGTGKELLARAIHQLDLKARHGPFIAVNCGAISSGLAESELFGHRRGAFTGAERDRKGLIRAAEGGIVFLDEIGELDDSLQVKLLRVLQERRVLGVGDDQDVPVSVRVIAATNRNLSAAVKDGKFRADLFHRLNVLAIHIPSLRERRADLAPLIEHLLEKNRFLHTAGSVSAGPDFIEALTRIDLPGNVRQLENLVRRALVNKVTLTPLTLTDLPAEVWQQLAEQEDTGGIRSEQVESENPGKPARETGPQTFSSDLVNLLDTHGWNLAQTLRYCERILLESALRRKRGNRSQTARLLGLTPRSVYSKIRKHHLSKRLV